MKYLRGDMSTGKPGKKYDRSFYECRFCDVWVTVELPQEKEAE